MIDLDGVKSNPRATAVMANKYSALESMRLEFGDAEVRVSVDGTLQFEYRWRDLGGILVHHKGILLGFLEAHRYACLDGFPDDAGERATFYRSCARTPSRSLPRRSGHPFRGSLPELSW